MWEVLISLTCHQIRYSLIDSVSIKSCLEAFVVQKLKIALVERMRSRPNTEWLSEHDVEAAFAATLEQAQNAKGSDEVQGAKSTPAGETDSAEVSRSGIQLQPSKL